MPISKVNALKLHLLKTIILNLNDRFWPKAAVQSKPQVPGVFLIG